MTLRPDIADRISWFCPQPPCGKRGRRRARGGYVLIVFAMLFFCLLGLAALVIDMGFARLARQQMQTAADSAALEGLRWRDSQQGMPTAWKSDPNYEAEITGTGTADQVRRWAASQVVADGPFGTETSSQPSMFAEYYDATGGTVHFGAGPVVNFTGGIEPSQLAAGQTMTINVPPVYQPVRGDGTSGLELNYSTNANQGDMVSGTYGFNSGFEASLIADEDGSYNRRDFTPALVGSSTASAFLVRMRRTNNIYGLDNEAGISSGGPPLPILFGRGSLMARSGTSGQLSVSSGITVRATAIAAAGPVTFGTTTYNAGLAKTVGPVDSGGTYPGHVPFAINSDVWAELATSGGTLTVSSTGTMTITGGTPGAPPDGLVLAPSASGTTLSASSVAGVGQLVGVGSDSSSLGAYPAALPAYIPIYTTTTLGSQEYTVIGFGYLAPGRLQSSATQVVILPGSGASQQYVVASQNASGVMGLPTLAGFSAADVETLFGLPSATGLAPYMVFAPVLVDHYIGPNSQ